MNGIFKNTLAIAGLLSIMTFSAASADDRLIMDKDVTLIIRNFSGISTSNAGNGGAILNNGYNLSILGGSFSNNILEAANQAVFGGAIYQAGGTLTIANGVVFDGNRVQSVSQRYEGWDGQDGPAGGAIYINAVNATIGNVTFNNNHALNSVNGDESNGGAMFIQGAPSVAMGNVVFSNNSSVTRGGAIYNGDSLVDIEKGEFTGNTSGSGGAVWMYDVTGNTVLNTGNGSKFDSNRATSSHGGAIANYNGVVNVEANNTFSNNTAANNGGAIYNATYYSERPATTNIAGGTSFTGNSAQKGGAIYNSGLLNLDSTAGDITFSGNTAQQGSSVYLDGTAAKLTLKGDSNSVIFEDDGAIAGNGSVEKIGNGTVSFKNNTNVSGFTGKYTHKGGKLELSDSSKMFNNYEIQNGEFYIVNGSSATINATNKVVAKGVDITVGGSSITRAGSENAVLNLDGVRIGDNNVLNVLGGGQVNVAKNSSLIFDSNNAWEGDVNNAGSVVLDGFTHSTASGGGNYVQNSGSLALNNGSTLTLGNAESKITNGTVSVGSGNTLNVEGGSVISGGQTNVGGALNVGNNGAITGGTTTVQNGGNLSVNSGGSISGGTTSVQNGGNLNVNAGGAINGNANTTIQSGGTLTVNGGTINSTGKTDIRTGSSLVMQNNGNVTLHKGDNWSGSITNNGSTLTLNNLSHNTSNGAYTQSGGTLNLDNNSSLSLDGNGSITDGIINVTDSSFILDNGGTVTGGTINMGDGSIFDMKEGGVMSGGKVEFTGENTTINVNGTVIADAVFDITNGKVAIGQTGNLTVNSGSTTGDLWDSNASVELNGGTFNFEGTKNGGNGTFIGNSGILNVAGGSQGLVIGEGGLISNNVNTTINNGSLLDISGGDVSLNSSSVWNGNVNISNGNLNLNNASKAATGQYVQTGGTTNLVGNLDLNNANDSVTGGTLNIGSASDVGAINMSNGVIGSDAALNIAGQGALNISGGEATLNGTGDGADSWAGTVDLTGGTLNLNGIQNDNGKLLASGGALNVTGSELTLANGSNITSGSALNLAGDSILNVTNNGSLALGTDSVWAGAVNLNNGGIFTFEGTKDGTQGAFNGQGGNLVISGGSQNFVVAEGSLISDAVNTTINGGSVLDITGGDVALNNNTVWNGDVNISSGNLALNNASKNSGGKFNQTGGTSTVTGNFALNNTDDSVTGGTFNIGAEGRNGTVNQSAGTIASDAIVNIADSGTLNITGGQTSLTGTGDAADNWAGTIGLAQSGVLNLNEITSNGKLMAQGGILNITGSELTIADGSLIAKDADVAFSADSILNVGNNGGVAFDKDSEWAGTVNLKGGALDFAAQSNGALHAESGRFTSSADSILNIAGGSYIENAVNTNIQGLLNISGTSAEDTGRVALNDGDTLLGNTNINDFGILDIGDNVNMGGSGQKITFGGADSTMNLVGNNNLDLKAELVGANGQINKEGSGDVIFSGGTSNFTGNMLVDNSGNLTFVDADGFGGNLEFGNIDGKKIGIFADKIQGAINQDKNAEITYSTYRDIDLFFNDKVQVSDGKLIALSHAGNDIVFNELVEVTNGASFLAQSGRDIEVNTNLSAAGSADGKRAYVGLIGNSVATKDITADNTLIFANAQKAVFENLNLNNSTLQMAQNGFRADSISLAGNSDVLMMNGTLNDANADYITLADGATGNFSIDISPRDWKSDRILAGAITADGKGTLNISDFQFINKCPIDKNVPITVFNTSNPGYENIMFTATNKEVFTPIGYYGLFPTGAGNGTFRASLTRYNPQVFRGQVATIASWQNQLVVNNILFDHVQEINMQYLSQSNPNKYAAAYPQFAPYQYNKKDGSLWVKPFGVVERMGMTQGLNVNNTYWGALIGADFPALDLKKGWTMLPTAYIGYTGGHQSFNGVGMTQNGGQAGAMATFMKNEFIGSILAYGGGFTNNMDVAGFTDNTGNWFAGTAAKAAYNFHPSKHFIIQPTFLASYNYYGQQNWHTNFGDMSMRADMMHGVNVAPGINFIYGRETWSVYATIQYFYNILGYAGGRAGNDVWLPHVRMRHGFLQYGIGATKTWKDRFSAYFQFIIRNGGRTGVGFQGGLNFKL